MKISSKGRYAVRLMVEIATSNKECVSLSEIAEKQNLTIKYLEQIVSKLVKANLLISSRGAQGGYKLAKPANKCTIAEILAVTNDLPEFAPCLKGNKKCDMKNKCTTIGCWETLSNLICNFLQKITLQDLIDKNY